MTTEERMNKAERMLYAAKNNLKYLKNRRWIDTNYNGQPGATDPVIQQTEAEIIEHRKTLKELYQTILA